MPGDVPTAGERNVWMPWPQIRLESGGERRFLHTFVNLKEVRMTFPNADPDDVRRTFRRECAEALHWKKKAAEVDGSQSLFQLLERGRWDAPKKSKGEMHLFRSHPLHTANLRIKSAQCDFDRIRTAT